MAGRGKKGAKKEVGYLQDFKKELKKDLKEDLKKDLKEEIKKEVLNELSGKVYAREYYKIDEKPEESSSGERFQKEVPKDEFSEGFERQSVEFEVKKPMNKFVKALIFLVAIVLIIDLIVLIFYFNPNILQDLKKNTGSVINNNLGNNKCRDGTAYDACSSTKPMYCYQGQLIAKGASCGCPSEYTLNFQDCVKANSS